MVKFNRGDWIAPSTRARVTSPVRTRVAAGGQPDAVTFEGGPAFSRTSQSELFMLAVSNFVGEDTFYEGSTERDKRYRDLVARVAIDDPIWLFEMLVWLRTRANMRSAAIVGAVEAVRAWLANGSGWSNVTVTAVQQWQQQRAKVDPRGLARVLIDQVCQRADEPGEMLGYYFGRYGRALPMPIKRGLADAVRRLYTEYAALKYDTATRGGGGGFRFADVLELTHPKPWVGPLPSDPEALERAERIAATRAALFKYLIDVRHDRTIDRIEERLDLTLPMIDANHTLRWLVQSEGRGGGQPDALLNPENVKGAGFTWEDVLSLGGTLGLDKRKLWESVIPSMGYMALLRNLRNFDQQGVPDRVADQVAARLADPEQVARSRQFPFRFYSAYRAAPSLRWSTALDRALTYSVRNIPLLPGRTLVLCDTSASMTWTKVSGKSDRNCAEIAALFGVALACRAANADGKRAGAQADLVGFADYTFAHQVQTGGSVLKELERFTHRFGEAGGGTDIAGAVHAAFQGHDRVVILSDMQTMRGNQFAGYYSRGSHIDSLVPRDVPVYGFNLAGYANSAMPSGGGNRHEIGGGLTDAAFRMIPLLEAGKNGVWPWELGDEPSDH